MSTGRLVLWLCAAEALGLAGFATFPALMPTFIAEWGLSNTQAGTLSGAYFAGYMASVTLLVALTDRRDARWIYLGSVLVSALAGFGFALVADGFWTGLVFQAAAGVGVAGTYMPGLKILSDRVSGPRQSRWVSFYTATFSIGAAGSFLMAGEVGSAFGWQWAFAAAGLGALLSGAIVLFLVPASERPAVRPDTHLFDLRPVLRCRPAMAYILGYAGHIWELFALRGWMVAFLAWVAAQESGGRPWLSATAAAALINLIGLFASIGGNELAMRFGRRRVLLIVMIGSAVMAVGIGASAGLPYGVVVALCMLYSVPVMADSAALTAGAVEAAPAGYRGATLAVHSTLGFGCGFLGSLAVGIVLDAAGGASAGGWIAAFAVIGAGAVAGAAAVAILGRARRAAPETEGMTEPAKKPKRTHWENLVTILRHHGVTLVLDVGGHRGEYAGYLRRAGYDGRIVSFEPQSTVHGALVEKAMDDPAWTVAPRMAVGDRDGTVTLNISAETDMSSALPLADAAMAFTPSSRMVSSEEVPIHRLATLFDDFVGPDDTVFVKVDTQGFERPVVEGAEAVMDRIAGWQLEMSIVEIYEREPDWRAMVDAMAARGYEPHLFIPGYFSRHIARQLQIDGVFFRPGADTKGD